MLGDILAQLTDETIAVETILGAGDLALLAAVKQQAAVEGLDLGACVVQTVQRYTNEANDEEWVTLIGLMNRTNDPAAICLKRAFEHSFTQLPKVGDRVEAP
jgi:hypothetical protein